MAFFDPKSTFCLLTMKSFIIMEVTAFFLKDRSCISPKLALQSILLLYKDRLEIESCLLGAIFEQIF